MSKKVLLAMVSVVTVGFAQTVQSQALDAVRDGSLLLLSPMAMVSSSAVTEAGSDEVAAVADGSGALPEVTQKATPTCRVLAAGFVGNEWKKFRISANRKIVGGADSIEDLAETAAGLERMSVCEFKANAVCRLTEEGLAGGQWRRVRLELNGQVLTGVDHFSELAPMLDQMVESRFCKLAAQECELSGEGPVGGAWQKHRITLDGAAIFGAQDLGTILNQTSFLREIGLCH